VGRIGLGIWVSDSFHLSLCIIIILDVIIRYQFLIGDNDRSIINVHEIDKRCIVGRLGQEPTSWVV